MIKLNEKDHSTFFKCATCGRLVGVDGIELCAGHHQKKAYYVTLLQWIKIKTGLLK